MIAAFSEIPPISKKVETFYQIWSLYAYGIMLENFDMTICQINKYFENKQIFYIDELQKFTRLNK